MITARMNSRDGTLLRFSRRDDKVLAELKIDRRQLVGHIENDIKAAEKELDDDAESIITNERYVYIASTYQGLATRSTAQVSFPSSDKIDRIVTNRWLGTSDIRSCNVPCILHCNGNSRFQ